MWLVIGSYDVQDVEMGRTTNGEWCWRCWYLTGATMDCLLNVYNDTMLLVAVSGLILENQSPYSSWSCEPGYSGVSQVTVIVRDHDRRTQTSYQ